MNNRFLLLTGCVALLAAACSTEPVIETLPPPAIIEEEQPVSAPPSDIAAGQPLITATPAEIAAVQVPSETPTPILTATEVPYVSSLPNLGPAPELVNEVWLNTDTPLRLADLRGQVVLLDMWTFD